MDTTDLSFILPIRLLKQVQILGALSNDWMSNKSLSMENLAQLSAKHCDEHESMDESIETVINIQRI